MEISLSKILNEVVEDMTKQGVLQEGGGGEFDGQWTKEAMAQSLKNSDAHEAQMLANTQARMAAAEAARDGQMDALDAQRQMNAMAKQQAFADAQAQQMDNLDAARQANLMAKQAAFDAKNNPYPDGMVLTDPPEQSMSDKVGAWWDGLSGNQKLAMAAGGGALGGAMAAGAGALALRKKLRATQG